MRVSEGAWERVTGRVRVSGWERIFEMRVKVRESTTCESMARAESVLKSACDSASESASEWLRGCLRVHARKCGSGVLRNT